MQLISGLVSNNAAKVRMVLAEKGIAYETTEVPWTKTNAWEPKPQVLLDNNPRAQVPVLIDDGLTLWDSTVINEYLEDQYPGTSLRPSDPVACAECRLWEDEGDHNQAHVGVLIRDVFLNEPGAPLTEDASIALTALGEFYDRLDRRLSDREYLCGEYSLADISVFMTLVFATTLGAEIAQPNLQGWFTRMLDRPVIKTEYESILAAAASL